jgi:hypothetical protein
MRPFLSLTAAMFLFAGCLAAPKDVPTDAADGLAGLIAAGPAHWTDPQNAPHPAFNYATLSNPPAQGANVPTWWAPIPAAELPPTLSGIELLSATPDDLPTGAGIALFGSLAIVPGYQTPPVTGGTRTVKPSAIVDISDPAHPKTLSHFDSQGGLHRGAIVIPYPDGRLVTVISTSGLLDVFDITDPRNPVPLTPVEVRTHKVGVIPGTPIVYNAASGGGDNIESQASGVTEMFDFSDPENVVRLPDFQNGFSCHHVFFWNDPAHDKYRGICAGIEYAQLWDTKDPYDPKVIVSVPIFHGVEGTPSASAGATPFAHYAGLSNDGTILIVGDENGGGTLPPGCLAAVDTPRGTVSAPVGALFFYDVSVETEPRLLGWYSPLNDPRVKAMDGSCTAHHGRMVPADGRDVIAMSWYKDGVIVVDFTDVDFSKGVLPKVVDQFVDGSHTWEAWYYNGYLFTGDLARGMDVLAFQ